MHWGHEQRNRWMAALIISSTVLFWLHTNELAMAEQQRAAKVVAYVK